MIKIKELRIGVVGYSGQKFNTIKALNLIRKAYDNINSLYPKESKTIVSGLSNLGIPAIAFREAIKRKWRTVGISCSKASKFTCFPVDEKIITGTEWSEESPVFLNSIDILVRVGGGNQSITETAEMKRRGKPVFEYDLPAKKESH